MEKYEEEKIPLLDLATLLNPEDVQNYFEAFKQFDRKNTGNVSNRVWEDSYFVYLSFPI